MRYQNEKEQTDSSKRPTAKWENGKNSFLNSVIGYEFYREGMAVSAVQNPLNTIQKKIVWLKKDLPDNMKMILAATAAVMLTMDNRFFE